MVNWCSPLGSGDIVGGNVKLILGLIWTLILHYQISMGFGLEDQPHGGPTPKQALLDYINVSHHFLFVFPSVLCVACHCVILYQKHVPLCT